MALSRKFYKWKFGEDYGLYFYSTDNFWCFTALDKKVLKMIKICLL